MVFRESRRPGCAWPSSLPLSCQHTYIQHTLVQARVGLHHLKLPSSPQQAGAQDQEAEGQESRFNIQGEHELHTP